LGGFRPSGSQTSEKIPVCRRQLYQINSDSTPHRISEKHSHAIDLLTKGFFQKRIGGKTVLFWYFFGQAKKYVINQKERLRLIFYTQKLKIILFRSSICDMIVSFQYYIELIGCAVFSPHFYLCVFASFAVKKLCVLCGKIFHFRVLRKDDMVISIFFYSTAKNYLSLSHRKKP
jgi:hypothetical protein